MASILANVNPDLLTWAREESGYPSDLVAKRIGVKVERLAEWERGDRKPTVRQVQDLAKCYHRSFGVFFLPQRPTIPPLAAEYRRLPGVLPGVESPECRLALRQMSLRRERTLELNDELAVVPAEFTTVAHLSEGSVAVGRRLRDVLGLTVAQQTAWRDEWQAWQEWRSAVENIGVLVFQFPKVPLNQARGVSLLHFPSPVVGVNSKEVAPGARIFTLLHELVHVALALGQEERVALREGRNDTQWAEVERFAEEAASEAAVPEDALRVALRSGKVARNSWDVAHVKSLAAKFRVTPLAMATRLRAAGEITWDGYARGKHAWAEYVSGLKVRTGGMSTPVDKALSRGGRPFAQLVLEALDANRITAVDASRYLDLRFDHIATLRTELVASTGAAASDDGS